MKDSFIIFSFIILSIVTLYLNMWHQHTSQVQARTAESFEEFKLHDIIWETADITSDRDALLSDIRTAIIHNSMLFHRGAFRDEGVAYRSTIYDLIKILVNTPDDHAALLKQRVELIQTQQEYYDAIENFISNKLHAMWYTM